jgi:hypothetical protein
MCGDFVLSLRVQVLANKVYRTTPPLISSHPLQRIMQSRNIRQLRQLILKDGILKPDSSLEGPFDALGPLMNVPRSPADPSIVIKRISVSTNQPETCKTGNIPERSYGHGSDERIGLKCSVYDPCWLCNSSSPFRYPFPAKDNIT